MTTNTGDRARGWDALAALATGAAACSSMGGIGGVTPDGDKVLALLVIPSRAGLLRAKDAASRPDKHSPFLPIDAESASDRN